MPKRLKKAQEGRKMGPGRLWPRSLAGSFSASFAAGLLLAAAATAAAREWSRSGAEEGAAFQTGPPRSSAQVESLLARGSEAFSQERYADAFLDFSKASQLAPRDPRPHHGMGQVYLEIDRTELAHRSLRRALELVPDYLPSQRQLARVLYDLGKTEESLEILKGIAQKEPEEPDHWWWIAKNELRLGNAAGALQWLRKYTAALPRNPWGFAYLGRALAETGNREEAEKNYRLSLDIDAKIPLTWLWLGQLLVAAGRRSEADQALGSFRRYRELEEEAHRCARTLQRRPDDFDTLVKLARIRILLGMERQAMVVLERALRLRPEDPELRRLHEGVTRALGAPAPGQD